MRSRRPAENFSLAANPTYLDFLRTDGNVSTWPTQTTRIIDHEGHVNYYEPLTPEHPQHIRWRTTVADAVARHLNMPDGPTYVFRSFPDGYGFFDHNKGIHSSPRHDLYLYGSKSKFRSVNEFIPHAIWLMGDSATPCTCKYCGGIKAQREITASMSNILRITPSLGSPSPSRIKSIRDKGKGREFPGRSRPRDSKVYAAVQRTIKPLRPSANVLKQPMLVERNNDLRAIYSKTSMRLRRFFREGEVVWCALEPPIPGPSPEDASIEFWPGVIDEIKLKTEPIPQSASGPVFRQCDVPQASSSAMQLDSPQGFGARGPILEANEQPLPWTIRQSTKYKVQLLAVSHSYTIDDDQVLPYQAYVPQDGLIRAMTNFPVDKLNFDKDALSAFNPCPGLPPPTFSEAVNAYATALQIASIISTYWCLTDDYELRYSIPIQTSPAKPNPSQRPPSSTAPLGLSQPAAPPLTLPSSQPIPPVQTPIPPPPPPPPMQPPQVYTLQMAIEAAGRHNAQLSRDLALSTASRKNVTAVDPNLSESEVRKISNKILGAPPPPNELVQRRFQGFWWGAERIWADDFIRLKIPRRTLAPNGAQYILAPSGPGREELQCCANEGRDPSELGAGTRGVFLRLDGIIAVDIPNGSGGMKKEARVCGMLYELAADDWDDPNEEKPTNAQPMNPPPSHPENAVSGPSITPDLHFKSSNGTTPNNDLPNSGLALGNILPEPPRGFKFRPILTPGFEFVGGMGLVSGRYYPDILQHPKMISTVKVAIDKPLVTSNNLWALEGLSGGYFNSVDPRIYRKSRIAMMQDADKEALAQLQDYLERKLIETKPSTQDDDDVMDVDEIFG
ncbi:hypothetical protein M413DRAFT_442667 [Hebeloma cylindrosporum]|uniref:Cryptic loci regulator 2 N-terminal domain-containing protein n=1 Tax=Hebeloma cylindrosporum TaxID=76867 RepID=A0A0C3CLR8_HEBCY|nr:hypothetical protein M413DRAFT_442667 [Hebeloma cylindrosporum h7]